jgi:hypothetical protein
MRSAITRVAFLIVLVAGASVFASGQHGYRVTKRVTFKKGQVSTTVSGTIPNKLEVHEYIVRARKGQTLMLNLSHPRRSTLWFYTMSPSNAMVEEEPALRNYTGTLEETGDYHIFVYTTKGSGTYSLEIQIATDI